MTKVTSYLEVAARVLLAVLFINAGIGKLGDVQGFIGYMAYGGIPSILAWPVIGLEILGGLAILAGLQTRLAALALAAFSLAAAFLFHFDPSDQMQMIMFMKNLGLAGGFLLLAVHGAGSISVDARRSPASVLA